MSTRTATVDEVTSHAVPIIQLQKINKSFGKTQVLFDIDLTIERGQHVVLFGPSGSGKSTVLRSINLLADPDSGSLKVDGVEFGPGLAGDRAPRGGRLALRRRVGMVFQQFNLFPHLCALDNVALPLRKVRGMSRSAAREKAAVTLRRVGLIDRAANYPAELSGGQQQRVAIARALALDPEVMLFDEPTSALDPELVGEVLKTMREVAETGMTMVVVTHELGFAREIGDLNVFMEDGRIVETGPRGFYDNCRSERAREFLRAVM
ncbi:MULTISPECIES: amino acid ABC transporter ATP-binding protein [unclassified Microbacterium]|uniref:amino acid ABC transporter ATP-binding protein n=1 Tax=unclassified Microbacterium TaxID=2609290 RepID=UPI000F554522|nr:amino acid ABC transporter ATP-binding protein [Microbacterium sp. ABRD28]AZC14695.1 amino acid ABC transporter ATP-binding protein [Microbacterium sp. ABRD28]